MVARACVTCWGRQQPGRRRFHSQRSASLTAASNTVFKEGSENFCVPSAPRQLMMMLARHSLPEPAGGVLLPGYTPNCPSLLGTTLPSRAPSRYTWFLCWIACANRESSSRPRLGSCMPVATRLPSTLTKCIPPRSAPRSAPPRYLRLERDAQCLELVRSGHAPCSPKVQPSS